MNIKFQRKNHKKAKIIVILIMCLSFLMICLSGYLIYINIVNRPLIEYPKYTVSMTDWTSNDIIITVLDEDKKISSYSFDGGNNYQESNTYVVSMNSDFQLIVKDINGRISKMVPISIRNIDKDNPIISFENNTTVQLGSNFSLRTGVQVYDEDSGLSSNYVVVPDKIDASIPGEYIIKYTAFDKVGNFTEKERKIVVMDITGRTYYRYRDATIETYQCDSYMCNCVVSESATLSKSCPSGYTFNEPNKCCQTCYKTCQKSVWGEWSSWSQNKVTPSATREVETKIE